MIILDTLQFFSMKFHFNPDLMATILSLKDVSSLTGVKIAPETSKEWAIIVSLVDGGILKFKSCEEGIYYYDTTTNNTKT